MMCIIHSICFHNMCVMYVFVLSYVSYMYPITLQNKNKNEPCVLKMI